ncbi:UNVERIFIED_ORG: hypothetical protein ABIB13_001206 [Arthrobacter sp. UYEF2]
MPIDSVLGPGQLRTLGSKLQAGASEMEQQRSNLSRVLDSTNWEGPDANHFRANGQARTPRR